MNTERQLFYIHHFWEMRNLLSAMVQTQIFFLHRNGKKMQINVKKAPNGRWWVLWAKRRKSSRTGVYPRTVVALLLPRNLTILRGSFPRTTSRLSLARRIFRNLPMWCVGCNRYWSQCAHLFFEEKRENRRQKHESNWCIEW